MTEDLPTVTDLLKPLTEVDDRGVYFEDSFVNWRDHLRHGAAVAATLRELLDPDRPPHVGVLLENTPFFCAVLVAAGMSGIVPVGLNPVRRGAALHRDIDHADCQLVLADTNSVATLGDTDHINVDSAAWADEVAEHRDAGMRFQSAGADDLFMLIFTSGTSGEPKAVKCSHGKVAIAGMTMTDRFSLGRNDVCYASMPLFHSNAVLVGWAVALACRGSMVLRRKFSASQFLPDVRRYGATYANYVGKPLSYVLATPERPDDADNPLRAVYGNEGAPGDIERFASRFGCLVIDGFGSTEGGVAIGRTPDTPTGALGPLPDGIEIIDVAGTIDIYTAPRLRELLIEQVSKDNYQLIVNLDKVEFLDSTGLGVLVGGLKRVRAHDGSLDLVCTQERILKIFRITGLTKVFGIHETVDQAIATKGRR